MRELENWISEASRIIDNHSQNNIHFKNSMQKMLDIIKKMDGRIKDLEKAAERKTDDIATS